MCSGVSFFNIKKSTSVRSCVVVEGIAFYVMAWVFSATLCTLFLFVGQVVHGDHACCDCNVGDADTSGNEFICSSTDRTSCTSCCNKSTLLLFVPGCCLKVGLQPGRELARTIEVPSVELTKIVAVCFLLSEAVSPAIPGNRACPSSSSKSICNGCAWISCSSMSPTGGNNASVLDICVLMCTRKWMVVDEVSDSTDRGLLGVSDSLRIQNELIDVRCYCMGQSHSGTWAA